MSENSARREADGVRARDDKVVEDAIGVDVTETIDLLKVEMDYFFEEQSWTANLEPG